MKKTKERKQKKKFDSEEEYNIDDEIDEINSNRAVFRKYPELFSNDKWLKDYYDN